MAQFKFRLEKLLEYRQLQEKWAKDAYMECRAKMLEAEADVDAVKRRKSTALIARPCSFDERVSLESYVIRLEDEQRAAEAAFAIMGDETEIALEEWHIARQDAEAMVKLREADLADWTLEESRREQRELDEWAVLRRAS
jgi:flagellar export protein FliJ